MKADVIHMHLCMGISELRYWINLYFSNSIPAVPAYFVGREEEIENIMALLDSNNLTQIVSIVGPPGFGKSTLAIKIGHLLLRKGATVIYVDMRNVDSLVHASVLVDAVGSPNKTMTLDRLKKWVRHQWFSTVIILDDCDAILERKESKFRRDMRQLLKASVRKNIKYLMTSTKWEVDVPNYRLYPIYNLSTEAACEMLGQLIPTLKDEEILTIANLTGNVPMALELVSAVFNHPRVKDANKVIQGLRENVIAYLSQNKITGEPRIDAVIDLAYQYLSPIQKDIGQNLSYFPGSFDFESAVHVIHDDTPLPDDVEPIQYLELQIMMVADRSLLQSRSEEGPKHFHKLIQKFFLRENRFGSDGYRYFCHRFQLRCAQILFRSIQLFNLRSPKALTMLEADQHNFQDMFHLLVTFKHPRSTILAIQNTYKALKVELLQLRFSLAEVQGIVRNLMESLASFTEDDIVDSEDFYRTYFEVSLYAARRGVTLATNKVSKAKNMLSYLMARTEIEEAKTSLATTEVSKAKDMLSSVGQVIDGAFTKKNISNTTYFQFYTRLAQYYRENGEEESAKECIMHISRTVQDVLGSCHPNCDYFTISEAYANVGDQSNRFHYKQLAFTYQLKSLDPIDRLWLLLTLYSEYSNRNDTEKSKEMAEYVIEAHRFLLDANAYDFSELLYYNTIAFLKAQGMESEADQIQLSLLEIYNQMIRHINETQGDSEAARYISKCVQMSFKKRCYHIAIPLGHIGHSEFVRILADYEKEVPDHAFNHALRNTVLMMGEMYYELGDYGSARTWYQEARKIINQQLKSSFAADLRIQRTEVCYNLILLGDFRCSSVLLKELFIYMSVKVMNFLVKPALDMDTFTNYLLQFRSFTASYAETLSETTDLTTVGFLVSNYLHGLEQYININVANFLLLLLKCSLSFCVLFFCTLYSCRHLLHVHPRKWSVLLTTSALALMWTAYMYGGVVITDLM